MLALNDGFNKTELLECLNPLKPHDKFTREKKHVRLLNNLDVDNTKTHQTQWRIITGFPSMSLTSSPCHAFTPRLTKRQSDASLILSLVIPPDFQVPEVYLWQAQGRHNELHIDPDLVQLAALPNGYKVWLGGIETTS